MASVDVSPSRAAGAAATATATASAMALAITPPRRRTAHVDIAPTPLVATGATATATATVATAAATGALAAQSERAAGKGGAHGQLLPVSLPLWSPNDGLRTLASVVPSPHEQRPEGGSSTAAAHAHAQGSGKRPREIAPTPDLTASPATTAAALTLVHKAATLSRQNSVASSVNGSPPMLSPDDDTMFPLDGDDGEDTYSRKEKSLALLCRNFSDLFKGQENAEISLDTAARQLAVERRRIYDIVNVFESLDIMERLGKNRYRWNGLERIPTTIATLMKAIQRHQQGLPHLTDRMSVLAASAMPTLASTAATAAPAAATTTAAAAANAASSGKGASDARSRREKSLGILSLRFVVLFLTAENNAISLADAATALLRDGDDDEDDGDGDDDDGAGAAPAAVGAGSKAAALAVSVRSARHKTKVRRLYDIANILTALRVVSKVRQPSAHYSKPVFQWVGPYSRPRSAPAHAAVAPAAAATAAAGKAAPRASASPAPPAAAMARKHVATASKSKGTPVVSAPLARAPQLPLEAPPPSSSSPFVYNAQLPTLPARIPRDAMSPGPRPPAGRAVGARSSPDTPMAIAALTKAANSTDNAAIRSLFGDAERHPATFGPAAKRRRSSKGAHDAPLGTSFANMPAVGAASPIKLEATDLLPVPDAASPQPVWDQYYLNLRTAIARSYLENIRPSLKITQGGEETGA